MNQSIQTQLVAIAAEETELHAQVREINDRDARLQTRIAELEGDITAARATVETAAARLADAHGVGDDAAIETTRAALAKASKARDASTAAAELQAVRGALADLRNSSPPLGERLMALAQMRTDLGAHRIDELGLSIHAEVTNLAQQMAVAYAKAHALNRLAAGANLTPKYARADLPLTIILDGIGGGERIVIGFEGQVAAERSAIAAQLVAEGWNIPGVAL